MALHHCPARNRSPNSSAQARIRSRFPNPNPSDFRRNPVPLWQKFRLDPLAKPWPPATSAAITATKIPDALRDYAPGCRQNPGGVQCNPSPHPGKNTHTSPSTNRVRTQPPPRIRGGGYSRIKYQFTLQRHHSQTRCHAPPLPNQMPHSTAPHHNPNRPAEAQPLPSGR